MVLFAALLVGFLGSLHCIGMCGGIVGVMGSGIHTNTNPSYRNQFPFWFAYNGGRIFSYSVAGAIAGFLGSQAVGLFDPARVQNIGLMLAGAFMIILGLYISGVWSGLIWLEKAGGQVWKQLQPLSRKVLQPTHPSKAVLTGLIWGWLPCGLVYSMLVWSMTVATPMGGAMIMASFGIGTLPMLLGMGAASSKLNQFKQNKMVRGAAGGLIVLFGVLTFLGIVHPFHVPLFSNPLVCAVPE